MVYNYADVLESYIIATEGIGDKNAAKEAAKQKLEALKSQETVLKEKMNRLQKMKSEQQDPQRKEDLSNQWKKLMDQLHDLEIKKNEIINKLGGDE